MVASRIDMGDHGRGNPGTADRLGECSEGNG